MDIKASFEGAPAREYEPTRPKIEVAHVCEVAKHRKRKGEPNQDARFCLKEALASGVFDGLGGNIGAEGASTLAAEVVSKILKDAYETISTPEEACDLLASALEQAHIAIGEKVLQRPTVDRPLTIGYEMETTGVVSMITHTNGKDPVLSLAWVGDSRAILIRDNKAQILTLDDASWLSEHPEADRVQLQTKAAAAENISDLPKISKPRNMITQSIGRLVEEDKPVPNAIDIHTLSVPLQTGDIIVLVTDGISDVVPLGRFARVAAENEVADIPQALINEVRELQEQVHWRKKDDDATAEVIKLLG